jgi:signal transduction histidine kinase
MTKMVRRDAQSAGRGPSIFELQEQLDIRTRERDEALEQQAATAEVLKVISSSAGKLEPVFQTILENSITICEAKFGMFWLTEGHSFRCVALHGTSPAFTELRRREPIFHPNPTLLTPLGRIARTKQLVQVADCRAEQAYIQGDPGFVALVDLAGARTILVVPILRDDELVGVFNIFRQEVRPFTDKQIELVTNFASQAVIAIENTRLLNELRQRTDDLSESLEQLTATSDVLRVISSSPTNVQPVFDAIAESAVRLCDGQFSFVMRFDGKLVDFASYCGLTAEGLKAFRSILPMPASEDTAAGRAIVRRAVVEISDVGADPSYGARGRGLAKAVAYRSIAAVPLLHEGNPIGAIAVARANAGPFPKRQIVLLQAFADQAVIAIENVRLFDEVQARTLELAKSLEDLRTTQDRLVQTQKLALLGQLTAGIAHEIKNPLNFVNNFSGISAELVDELQDTLNGMPLDDKARTQINELTNMLKANFDKVVHHGKRADAIVKNMLQHSREGSGEHRVVDINALVEESLNLAWHGARAETQGFEIKFKHSFDPSAGEADLFPQDIRRALLNLISNGFYAANKRRAETNSGDYQPTLTASTKSLGDRVEIRIRDNGTGITPDVKQKMFEPFFTTKPTGEGTGLGLSISHDIIVKQHAGLIEIDTKLGEFTEIRIVLPRTAEFV